jgi:hypothetical protein
MGQRETPTVMLSWQGTKNIKRTSLFAGGFGRGVFAYICLCLFVPFPHEIEYKGSVFGAMMGPVRSTK